MNINDKPERGFASLVALITAAGKITQKLSEVALRPFQKEIRHAELQALYSAQSVKCFNEAKTP